MATVVTATVSAKSIIDEAQTVCGDLGSNFPTPDTMAFDRMQIRLLEVVSKAAGVSGEYYGREATLDLVNGEADILLPVGLEYDDIQDVASPFRITHVTKDDESPITIVKASEIDLHVPPRMMMRNNLLVEVGDDLSGESNIKVYYIPHPRPIYDRDSLVDIRQPWSNLLVWDLAKMYLRNANRTDENEDGPPTLFQMIMTIEEELMDSFLDHVGKFARSSNFFDDV